MAVHLNHTIVSARDSRESAEFLAEILGLGPPTPFGPFLGVETANGVTLDFIDTEDDIVSQHYAFLISEAEFDQIFARIVERQLPYWADPARKRSGEINSAEGLGAGGRGVYFEDPSGHFLEIITRPYAIGG